MKITKALEVTFSNELSNSHGEDGFAQRSDSAETPNVAALAADA